MVSQRDIWWADAGDPIGSIAGFRRPVIVIQGDRLNSARTSSYLCVPLTGNTRWGAIPWNVPIAASGIGLERDSVAQVSLALALAQSQLLELIGQITERQLQQIFDRLDLVLGRSRG